MTSPQFKISHLHRTPKPQPHREAPVPHRPQPLVQPALPSTDYAPILNKLATLSRGMPLAFRLEAAKLMLDQYFVGSARADRNHGHQ